MLSRWSWAGSRQARPVALSLAPRSSSPRGSRESPGAAPTPTPAARRTLTPLVVPLSCPGLLVPKRPAELRVCHARPKAPFSSYAEREEVAIEGAGEGSGSHLDPDPGVQLDRRQRWRRRRGSGTCVARARPAVGSAMGPLRTPRPRCGTSLRREEGSRVRGEVGLSRSGLGWGEGREESGGRPREPRALHSRP